MKERKGIGKRILSLVLAIALVWGTIGGLEMREAKAATNVVISGGGPVDGASGYFAVRLKHSTGAAVTDATTTTKTVIIKGANCSVTWLKYDGTSYEMRIPYTYFWDGRGSQSANNNLNETVYVTIPSGTTFGNMTFSENFYVRIAPNSMATGSCLIDQVSALPESDWHVASWHYTGSSLYVGVQAASSTAFSAPSGTHPVAVNGSSFSASMDWYTAERIYEFIVPWSKLGSGASYDNRNNIQDKLITIKPTTVGAATISSNLYFYVNNGTFEEMMPSSSITYDGMDAGGYRFSINTNRKQLRYFEQTTVTIKLNGRNASAHMVYKNSGSYQLFVPFTSLPPYETSDAGRAISYITLPAGIKVGNMYVESNLNARITGGHHTANGNPSIGLNETPSPDYMYNCWNYNDDGVYLQFYNTKGATPSNGDTTKTVYINGESKSVNIKTNEYGYSYVIPYSSFGVSGMSQISSIQERIVYIPPMTVGSMTLSKGVAIKVNSSTKMEVKPLEFSGLAASTSEDDGTDAFLIEYNVSGDTPVTGSGETTTSSIKLNGAAISGVKWKKVSDSLYRIAIPYSAFPLGSQTAAAGVRSRGYVTIPAGTVLGNYTIVKNYYVKIDASSIKESGLSSITSVSSIPSGYHYGGWNANNDNLVIRWHNAVGTNVAGQTMAGGVIINGTTSYSVTWMGYKSGTTNYWEAVIPWSKLPGTTNVITVPAGMSTNAVSLKVVKNERVYEVSSKTISYSSTSADDSNDWFAINISGADGLSGTVPVLINGVSKNVSLTSNQLRIPYSYFPNGGSPTTNEAVRTSAYVTLQRGTKIGSYVIANDISVEIRSKTVNESLALVANNNPSIPSYYWSGWNTSGTNYLLTFNSGTGASVSGSGTITALVNGTSRSLSYAVSNSQYQITIPYSYLAGSTLGTSANIIKIPSGTKIGNYTTSGDMWFKATSSGTWKITPVEISSPTSGGYDDSADVFKVNVTVNNASSVSTTSSTTSVWLNGKEITGVKWVYVSGTTYQLQIPYSAFPLGSGMGTNAEVKNSAYITIKKGTKVGSYTFASDVYAKIYSSTVTDDASGMKVEALASLPANYTYAGWNYSDDNKIIVVRFESPIGTKPSGAVSASANIVVNGTTKSKTWKFDADGRCYYFYLDYSELGATNRNNMADNIIKIPANTKVNGVTITTTDIWLQINSTKKMEVKPVQLALGTGSAANDSSMVYQLKLQTTNSVSETSSGTITAKVNGVNTSVTWSGASGNYQFNVPYSSFPLSSTFTTNKDVKATAFVTIPRGTKLGSYTLTQDVILKVYSQTMTSGDFKVEEVSGLPAGDFYYAAWNYSGGEKWISLQFYSAKGVAADGWQSADQTVYVNGKAVTKKWEGDKHYYYFKLSYTELGGTDYDVLGDNVIKIPAGTTVGTMTLSEDVWILVNSDDKEQVTPVQLQVGTGHSYTDSTTQAYHVKTTAKNAGVTPSGSGTITAKVNGIATSVSWSGASGVFQFNVPYSAFPISSSFITNDTVKASAYVTIPAGSRLGNYVVTEDLYMKVYANYVTEDTMLVEPVDKIPTSSDYNNEYDFYYAGWNFNQEKIVLELYPTDKSKVVSTPAVNRDRTIYINGTAVQVTWTQEATYHVINIPWSALGGSANGSGKDITNNLVRLPMGAITDEFYLRKDIWLKISPNLAEEVAMNEATVAANCTADDTNKRYIIRIKPADGKPPITPGASSTDILVDEMRVSAGISSWANDGEYYIAYVPYDKIKSGATTAAQVGEHLITIPRESYVGNIMFKNDAVVHVNGTSVKPALKVEFLEAGYQDNNDGHYRYLIWIHLTEAVDISGMIGKQTTIEVNGEHMLAYWTAQSAAGNCALAIDYTTLDPSAVYAADVGEFFVTLPKGTPMGDRLTANDLDVRIDGRTIEKLASVEMIGSTGGNDQWYALIFRPADGRTPVAPGNASNTIYVDGKEVLNAVGLWDSWTYDYCAYVKANKVEAGASKYTEVTGTHCIMMPKGTRVGDLVFANDVYFKISPGAQSPSIIGEKMELGFEGFETQNSAYKISLKVSGIANAAKLAGAAPNLYVADTQKTNSTIQYVANDSDTIDLILPYNVVKEGATSYSDITEAYIITIRKGVLFNGVVLTKETKFVVNGSYVAQVATSYTTVNLGAHSTNSTSGTNLLKFTSNPTDRLAVGGSYSFLTGGITVDDVKKNLQITKLSDTEYSVDLTGQNVVVGTIVAVEGMVQPETYAVKFVSGYFRYTANGWVVYNKPKQASVSFTNDTINGEVNRKKISMNATGDPLSNGYYEQSKFTWEEVTGEVKQHGGISVNGILQDSARLKKEYNGYWSIDLSSIASSLKSGDIITLDGTLYAANYCLTFVPISYMYNADGSYSQYSADGVAIPAETVSLSDVYVNIDEYGTFDIAGAPLVQNAGETYKVNGNVITNTVLNEAGYYSVTRKLENVNKAEIISAKPGDITYTQNVYLYETGDSNVDGKLNIADCVAQIKNTGNTSGLVKSANDLNGDGVMNVTDCNIVIDILLGKTAPETIYSQFEDVTVGAISDTHYLANGRDGQNRISTVKALNYFKSQNADVIIMNGDISDLGEIGSYNELVEDIIAVYPDDNTRPTFVMTGDNHEWYDAWTVNGHKPTAEFEDTQARFVKYLSEVRTNTSGTHTYFMSEGYHFIGISSDGMDGGQCTYDADTMKFVKEKLVAASAASNGKPIFLAIHQAPPNTVKGSEGADCFSSAEMEAELKKYPNLVVLTGHTHVPVQHEKSIMQTEYTTLNTASCSYAGGVSGLANITGGLMSDNIKFGQGLLLRVEGKNVDIERWDFYGDEKVKNNWTFTVGGTKNYTADRATSAPTPTVSSVQVSRLNDSTARVTVNVGDNKDSAIYYIVTVSANGSQVTSKKISSMYWNYANNAPSTLSVDISGLPTGKTYTISVVGYNSWDKTGNTATATFN